MSNKWGKDERRFVEDVARLLIPWGVPPIAARLYGHLLLCSRPVSLDQITEDLGISKSSASVAARLLESYTLARRHSEPGTKRALYAVADDYEAMIQQQNRLLDALAGQLNAGAGIVASKDSPRASRGDGGILSGDARRHGRRHEPLEAWPATAMRERIPTAAHAARNDQQL